MLTTLTPQQIIQCNKNQLRKISWKRKEALEMATSIKLFFDDNQLPLLKEMPTEYEEVSELSKMYFMLTGVNKSIVANFKQGNEKPCKKPG